MVSRSGNRSEFGQNPIGLAQGGSQVSRGSQFVVGLGAPHTQEAAAHSGVAFAAGGTAAPDVVARSTATVADDDTALALAAFAYVVAARVADVGTDRN